MVKTPAYTKEQQAAVDWLKELARLNRIAEAAIMMGRYEPKSWTEDAQDLISKLQATAAAGPGGKGDK